MRYVRTTVGGAIATVAALGLLGSMGPLGLYEGSAAAASAGGAGLSGVVAAKSAAAVESGLTGSATMDRGADGERVAFSFDAHGFAPVGAGGTSRGSFRFSHYSHDGTRGATFAGRIDCLLTGGPVATASGIITRSDHPDRRIVGKRVGFTVYDDGRHDRVGYSWAVDEIPRMKVPACLSAAPYETVKSGDFRVRHVLPPLPGEGGK
ncbi:hypothetical protein ACIQU1_31895 [Streptomyces angustmyceticus]|uniref:hypothetical protein n=1 Tax=Streptomyces angustmyceticus TaxID=285578 RepID=UPI0034510131